METMTDRDWKEMDIDVSEVKAIKRGLEEYKEKMKQQSLRNVVSPAPESPRSPKMDRPSVNPILAAASRSATNLASPRASRPDSPRASPRASRPEADEDKEG